VNSPPDSHRQIARSAGLTGVATLTSRLLGLARDQVLAALFGAGNEMDAFVVAFRVPNLVRDLFAEGAMSAAFVPTFTRQLTLQGRDEAWRLGNNLLNILLVTTAGLVIAGMWLARPIVVALAHDFAGVPGKLELTIALTRIMLPFLTMAAVAAAIMGMLNSLHHYFVPSLAPAMFNIATIACAFLLVPLMPLAGWPRITAIAMAALAGGALQIVVQWPPLVREGFHYRPVLDWRDRTVREVLTLMGPGTIGLAAAQVNLFVNTLLATSQGTGAVSWLGYAFRLMYLPIGLFGVSIGTAVLPAVSRHAAVEDVDRIRATVTHGMALMIVLSVPATLGLMALADPVVGVLFERGRFTAADTAATATAVRFYAIGLIGYASVRIVSPVFYAIRRNSIPVLISVASIVLNVVLTVILVRVMGFGGLALGTSLAALANAALSILVLQRKLKGIDNRHLVSTFWRTCTAAALMALAARGIARAMMAAAPGPSLLMQLLRLFASIGGAVTVLTIAARVLRIREFDDVRIMMVRRLGVHTSASI